ncbi:DUF4174 domain-containing protein [Phycisphaerales bacterium AB-hyl4]|uniref:DUF4174 domain-containing protein n=1 Tax=Natronomicrosphaera hydrolytica TaxID=3242702 RepID=A0ABV4U368_9BACT
MTDSAAASPLSLDDLTREHRLLLIVSPFRETGSLQWQQQAVSANHGALAKRDVRLATIIGEDEGYLDSMPMSRADVVQLREVLEVEADRFALILLDKGGKQLMSAAKPVKIHELLEKLDAAAGEPAG